MSTTGSVFAVSHPETLNETEKKYTAWDAETAVMHVQYICISICVLYTSTIKTEASVWAYFDYNSDYNTRYDRTRPDDKGQKLLIYAKWDKVNTSVWYHHFNKLKLIVFKGLVRHFGLYILILAQSSMSGLIALLKHWLCAKLIKSAPMKLRN